jgi:hypothetical protein
LANGIVEGSSPSRIVNGGYFRVASEVEIGVDAVLVRLKFIHQGEGDSLGNIRNRLR